MKPFWVYMLRCSDGSYYTGHTDKRLGEHQDGSCGGYTSARRPVELVWLQEMPSRDDAFLAEMQIKGWSRAKKAAMIQTDWDRVRALAAPRTGPDLRRGPIRISEMFPFAMGIKTPVVRQAHHERESEAHHERESEAHHERESEAHHERESEAHHEQESEAHHEQEVQVDGSSDGPLTLSLSKGGRDA